MRPLIVGVAGGSGSGKTTFSRRLSQALGEEICTIISQDSYYIDQSAKFDHDGGSVNFDHPQAVDFPLLTEQIKQLKQDKAVEVPHYDFATHSRQKTTTHLAPHPIIIIDGILIFTNPELVKEMDTMIFIDCPEQLRFERRLKRDVSERGRTPEGVKAQFFAQVAPMHDQFVAPTQKLAHDVVDTLSFDSKCLEWAGKLQAHLS